MCNLINEILNIAFLLNILHISYHFWLVFPSGKLWDNFP